MHLINRHCFLRTHWKSENRLLQCGGQPILQVLLLRH